MKANADRKPKGLSQPLVLGIVVLVAFATYHALERWDSIKEFIAGLF